MSHTGELPPGGFDSVRGSPAQHFQGIVTKMQDALMRGDLDTYCSYLAEDFEFADSGAPRVLTTLSDVRAFLTKMLGVFAQCESVGFATQTCYTYVPNHHLAPFSRLRARVAMVFSMAIRKANDEHITVDGVDVFEFVDDKIVRLTSYYHPPTLP